MENHFLHTLQQLRECEELVLYDRPVPITKAQQSEADAWLRGCWQDECIAYPGTAPAYDPKAAAWAAATVYWAAQLLLNRVHTSTEAEKLLPDYDGHIDAGAMLSADLLLRFLPDLLRQMALIDPDDALLPLLETRLSRFHYSGAGYTLPLEMLDWSAVGASDCLRLLYTDRVIAAGDLLRAQQPALLTSVRAALGLHAAQFWPAWQKENA